MNDYSEVTSTINSQLSTLNGLMELKKWDEARDKLDEIFADLDMLNNWLDSVKHSARTLGWAALSTE